MTSYNWYYILNRDEFEALGLISKTYVVNLAAVGQVTVVVTKGNFLGLTYNGVFLPLNLHDENPFTFDSHGVYIDSNNNVWLGLPVDA